MRHDQRPAVRMIADAECCCGTVLPVLPLLDIECPAGVGGLVDRVVDDDVAGRRPATVDAVQRNAAGVVVVEQIVFDARVLHAVHVDAAAAAEQPALIALL